MDVMALRRTREIELRVGTDGSDEAELVRRAAGGDDDAFRLLVRRILPRLRRWALARTGDPDDADEAVQRALIGMHRGLGTFVGTSRLSTWLYRVLVNATTDLHRSRSARPVPISRDATARASRSVEGDPLRSLHAARMAAAVRELFDALPPRQREVLVLVDHEGMRPVEVAEALELDPVTVRAHLLRARRTVRRRILERYPELKEGYHA